MESKLQWVRHEMGGVLSAVRLLVKSLDGTENQVSPDFRELFIAASARLESILAEIDASLAGSTLQMPPSKPNK